MSEHAEPTPVVGDPAQTDQGRIGAAARCVSGPSEFVLAASTSPPGWPHGAQIYRKGQNDRGTRPAVLADPGRGPRVTAPQADQGIQGAL
jgi:hypothetical protein